MTKWVNSVLSSYVDTGAICKKDVCKKKFSQLGIQSRKCKISASQDFLLTGGEGYADGINPKYYSKLCYTSL